MKKFIVENGRPDKPVPCPRCQSLNTKFCYFNNYNVKQPRHFCRECQRYWTAGGSLRNVPIGAGRRKHKIASTISSKLHGSAEANKLNNGLDNKCVYISSIEPYPSLPFKQLVTCNSNGNILQEVHSLMGMKCNDVMSVCGSKEPWFSQVVQKPAIDVIQNSSASMVSDTHRSNTMESTSTHCDTQGPQQLGFSEVLQNCVRKTALETKATAGHGADTSARILGHSDTGQSEVADVMDDDACEKVEPSHVHNTCELPLSNGVATHDAAETTPKAGKGESDCCATSVTPLASSGIQAATALSGSSPTKHNLPSAYNPLGLESTPAFWGPLMWPWIWPFLVSGANAAQVDPNWAAGLGALAASVVPHAEPANNASHIDMACSPTLAPSFPHWPYAWNPLPWGSPWNMAWNASNVGHGLLPQGPVKEKQGLLCIPKTLRMDRPDEAAHSSILRTLGVTSLPQSSAGFLNTFQPKADVFQPKLVVAKAVEHSELHHHPLPHSNPAAQARSVAFQEGS